MPFKPLALYRWKCTHHYGKNAKRFKSKNWVTAYKAHRGINRHMIAYHKDRETPLSFIWIKKFPDGHKERIMIYR